MSEREREEKETTVRAAGVVLWVVCQIRGQKVPSDSNGCNPTIDRSFPGLHKHWSWLSKALYEDHSCHCHTQLLLFFSYTAKLPDSLLVRAGDFSMEGSLLVSGAAASGDKAHFKLPISNHVRSSSSLPCQSSDTAMQNDRVLTMQPQAFDGGSCGTT